MRKIAIVGSGIAGCLLGHALRKKGCDVTLYSDRTPDEWLTKSRPTGTAGRFDSSLALDRELGIAHWDATAPSVAGVSLVFSPTPGNRLASLTGKFERPGLAIDVRLLSSRWMRDLEAAGGRVVIESVDVARLDAIAAEHDLTVVAAGRKELAALFPRHAARSVYDGPQRNLCMLCLVGPRLSFDKVPFLPVRFNLFGDVGEAFWVPYFHKDHGPSWNVLFEAKPGGRMDRFQGAKTGDEALAIAKDVVADLTPWDAAWFNDARLSDDNGWLTGGVAPTIREPVGRLPSGRVVTAIGDTIMSLDPIAGQGANNGTKMARHYANAVASCDGALDEAWIRATFEAYWDEQGRHLVAFNNALLEPLTPAARILLLAQYGSDGTGDGVRQRIADAFCANFDDPRRITAAFSDEKRAKAVVREHGGSHPWTMLGGVMRVARAQVRQKLGMAPGHPSHG